MLKADSGSNVVSSTIDDDDKTGIKVGNNNYINLHLNQDKTKTKNLIGLRLMGTNDKLSGTFFLICPT